MEEDRFQNRNVHHRKRGTDQHGFGRETQLEKRRRNRKSFQDRGRKRIGAFGGIQQCDRRAEQLHHDTEAQHEDYTGLPQEQAPTLPGTVLRKAVVHLSIIIRT